MPVLTRHRPGVALAVLGLAAIATGGLTIANAAGPGQSSNVVPLSPERILDTRLGTGAAAAPLGPGQTITLKVAGVGSIPADATGVILNITATRATAASFVSAWPTGEAQPTTSILNFQAGADIANMVTTTLGAGGSINLFNSQGSVDLIADVAGFLTPSGGTAPAAGSIVIDKVVSTGGEPEELGRGGGFRIVGGCAPQGTSGFQASIRAVDDSVVSFRGTLSKGFPNPALTMRLHQDEPVVPLIDNTAAFPPQILEGLISAPGGVVAHVTLAVTFDNVSNTCEFWAQIDPATRASGLGG
jgi:hypothetical protein